MRSIYLSILALTLACDDPERALLRDHDLDGGCAYNEVHEGPTGCVQEAALCYADLATFCEFDFWACYQWSEWCASEAQVCLKHASNG